MGSDQIYSISQVAEVIGADDNLIHKWIEAKIILPVITADGKPMFDSMDIVKIKQVFNLHGMGYDQKDILKITKKIGLPKAEKFVKKHLEKHNFLTVGELAKRAGINTRTIKYWEEKGIIEPASRSAGGFRLYDENYIFICTLIQDLQLFSYTLTEIKKLADLSRNFYSIQSGQFSGTEKNKYNKLKTMKDEIATLEQRMGMLIKGIERWKKLLKDKQGQINILIKKRPKKTSGKSVKKAP